MLSDPASERHTISNHFLEATFQPLAGGRMLRLRHADHGDLLVPLQDASFDRGVWPKAGAFPLFPFHNRVRDSRFRHESRLIRLKPNSANGADVIHGPAHRRRWRITEKGPDFVEMVLDYHADQEWPFDFTAAQRFELDGNSLSIGLSLTNSGHATMPGGLGWHPYFKPSRDGLVLTDARSQWNPSGPSGLPERRPRDIGAGGNSIAIDSTEHFSDWTKATACIGDGAGITFYSHPHLSHLVLHRKADYLCMEPASHVSGALAALPEAKFGLCLLVPGASLSGTVRLSVDQG
ncbi:aldose 1-epimerase [Roseibium salinum]|uniref:Aldose 1-epimerase n=1 Tax=Roseibium salinum TaxID=1604349 RepID=A0ABT3QVA7_9HYPH|nr:aldose 1-epimerase [Roseibium sp. DSM 29163]MCX2720857.1 aldose 1-epimerase [Roseibium sp. DSM 29163]